MIFIILVIVLGFTSFCLGKYTGYVTIKVKTEIANPKFAVEFDEPIEINGVENEKIYTFTVKNYEIDEKLNIDISEVDLEYVVQILSNTDSAIKYELFRENETININENLTSDYILMNANSANEHKYSLKITYEKLDSIENVEDIINNAQVKIYCKQVKII